MMRVRWPVLVFLATASATVALAQAETRLGQFRGRVLDSLSGLPIAGVTIDVNEKSRRQITDSSGRFMLVALPLGQYVIRVRRLGYQGATDTIRIQEDDRAERGFALLPLPPSLEEIVISGRAVKFPRFFEAAYKRAANGRGSFFTREDIEQLNAYDYQTLLNRIPGVSANARGVTFQRCQLGLEWLSSHRLKPKVQVWIDGHRMSLDAEDSSGVYGALGIVKPHSLQMMEVYPSVSSIPAEFLADACAVILIWTKRD